MDDNSLNIDQALLQAYLSTKYRLLRTSISIHIDQLNPDLDSFLIDNNAYTWVFISAENPQSVRLSPQENQRNYQELLQLAEERNYSFWEGLGVGTNTNWPPEQSLLILDLPNSEIEELVERFGQKAIVQGQINQKARLIVY